MASPRDELETIADFSPGLNLASSPLTFQAGETDLADNVWFDLGGAAHARPPLRAVLEKMGADIGTELIDTLALAGLGQKASVVVVTRPANNSSKTLRIDDLSPTVAPAQPEDLIWKQLRSVGMGSTAGRFRPVSVQIIASEGYAARPDGRVLHFSVGTSNQPVLLNELGTNVGDQDEWNDDYDAPQNPINVLSTVAGFPPTDVMLAVNAGSTSWMLAARGTRVRWSHALSYAVTQNGLRIYGPQDWALNDFTDLETTGAVTAMAHFRDEVLVFTSSDVFGLSGSPPDLNVVRHSGAVGTVSPHSYAVGPEGVWFYSHPEGLYLWDDAGLQHVSEKLGSFERAFHSAAPETLTQVAVGYKDRRVWLSVPPATADTEGHTFVLDLRLNSWSKHTYQATQFVNYDIGDAAGSLLAVLPPIGQRAAMVADVQQTLNGGKDEFVKTPYSSAAPTYETDVEATLRVGPMRSNVADMRARWRGLDVSADCAGLTVTPEYDGVVGSPVELGQPIGGLRRLSLAGRAWRLGLVLRWKGIGCVTATICRWWPGRREGNA